MTFDTTEGYFIKVLSNVKNRAKNNRVEKRGEVNRIVFSQYKVISFLITKSTTTTTTIHFLPNQKRFTAQNKFIRSGVKPLRIV